MLRWVQSTRLAVDAFADGSTVLAWASRLEDGAAVAGARVRITGADADLGSGTADSDGLVRMRPLEGERRREFERGEALLVVEDGADRAFLRVDPWVPDRTPEPRPAALAGLRRPRPLPSRREGCDQGLPPPLRHGGRRRRGAPARCRGIRRLVADAANGEEVLDGSWTVDDYGAFGGEIALPADIAVGPAILQMRLEGGTGLSSELAEAQFVHELHVAEFRRPEFEVSVSASRPRSCWGCTGVFEAGARYFAAARSAAPTCAGAFPAEAASYSPPGW